MNYKKSAIFSGRQNVDCRNLCLYFNFKNEKLDDICNLLKLIEKDLIEKFEEDFVFDMQFNEESITAKSLHKKFQNIENVVDRNFSLVYDAMVKSDKISSRADYRNILESQIFMEGWDLSEPELDFDINKVDSIQNYIIDNIHKENFDYTGAAMPQDMGIIFNCDYIKRKDQSDNFGYFGAFNFNISGYILDYDFNYFVDYLKEFIKKASKYLKSLCANMFISYKNMRTEYFDLFEIELVKEENDDEEYINPERYGLLGGIEGINFISNELYEKIDKNFLKDDFFEVLECENGAFINVDKNLSDVNIHDKYRVRQVLNDVLIKGYCDNNIIKFIDFLGKVPLYLDEVFLIESMDEVSQSDIFNRYFVLTKNRELGELKLDPAEFKVYKFEIE